MNKYCKRFREQNTRKTFRIGTDKGLLHMLLILSNPVISSLRNLLERKSRSFASEVLALLPIPTPSTATRGESPVTTSDHGSDSDYETIFVLFLPQSDCLKVY
jgi:hypothetical protein